MEWFENVLPMREPHKVNNTEYLAMADAYIIQTEEEELGDDWLDSYATTEILDARYEKANLSQVVKDQTHLNEIQQKDLRHLFKTHKALFGGTLGVYPHKKFHIEVEKDAQPKHSRPYAVPHVHLETFKKELEHLIELGVLEPQGTSEWALPTFIIHKKDGRVR